MRRAYLLIVLPAVMVGICYFLGFRSLGLRIQPGPFVIAALGIAGAILLVRNYLRRHPRRRGGS